MKAKESNQQKQKNQGTEASISYLVVSLKIERSGALKVAAGGQIRIYDCGLNVSDWLKIDALFQRPT